MASARSDLLLPADAPGLVVALLKDIPDDISEHFVFSVAGEWEDGEARLYRIDHYNAAANL